MKKLSLKGKFSFCMFVVMAIFFATEVILLGMQYYTKDRLGDLIDKSNRVYELKTTFSEVLSAYKYYSVSQKEDDREAAKEALERLRSDSASLRHVIFEDSYIREIDDLCHMADSLYEQIEPEIAATVHGTREERLQAYDEAAYTVVQLIEKYYDYVYPAMEQYSNEAQNELNREMKVISGICILAVIVFSLGILGMVLWFSRDVISPISALSYKAATYRSEREGYQKQNRDEVGQLTELFEEMLSRIEDQIGQMELNMKLQLELEQQRLEKVKMEKLLQESEIKALQARINPHFMFNTLNSIAQMAYLEEAPSTEQMIEAVSDYFRYNLKDIHHVATVADEVKNCRDYIYIQQIRFGKRIRFDLQYDETAAEGRIPALTLQPVIENAIVHGLAIRGGEILIRIHRKDGKIDITIRDNGSGMEEEKRRLIQSYIEGTDQTGIHSDSIGLKNVIDRMKAFFKDGFAMEIISTPEEGTEIRIRIPYEESLCIGY